MADDAPLTLAVLGFQPAAKEQAALAAQATDALEAALAAQPEFWLLERQSIESILEEQGLGMTLAAEKPAAAGQLLGAQLLVLGRVTAGPEEKGATLTAKILSVETGRVFLARKIAPNAQALETSAAEIAKELAAQAGKNRAQMVAKPVSLEDRIAALKAKVAGKKLPSISVTIPEVHMTRAIPDPAAETEIKRTLAAVGFHVVNPGAAEPANVAITGEAFSELGMRRGALIACRARVEIKARPSDATAAEIVDRETASAIDVAENVAAKSALQKAGLEIAERLAVKLAGE